MEIFLYIYKIDPERHAESVSGGLRITRDEWRTADTKSGIKVSSGGGETPRVKRVPCDTFDTARRRDNSSFFSLSLRKLGDKPRKQTARRFRYPRTRGKAAPKRGGGTRINAEKGTEYDYANVSVREESM